MKKNDWCNSLTNIVDRTSWKVSKALLFGFVSCPNFVHRGEEGIYSDSLSCCHVFKLQFFICLNGFSLQRKAIKHMKNCSSAQMQPACLATEAWQNISFLCFDGDQIRGILFLSLTGMNTLLGVDFIGSNPSLHNSCTFNLGLTVVTRCLLLGTRCSFRGGIEICLH